MPQPFGFHGDATSEETSEANEGTQTVRPDAGLLVDHTSVTAFRELFRADLDALLQEHHGLFLKQMEMFVMQSRLADFFLPDSAASAWALAGEASAGNPVVLHRAAYAQSTERSELTFGSEEDEIPQVQTATVSTDQAP